MRNIFLFIRRYSNFFAFLALQVLSLWFLFTYKQVHRAKFLGVANEITGRINTQYNKIEGYFGLKEENKKLHQLNDSLLNLLPQNFVHLDSNMQLIKDSVVYDTTTGPRRYFFRNATVVYNTVTNQKNYIQINKGSKQGIKDNMAVLNSDGSAVGIVVNVSSNFSEVMSLLHVDNTVNGSLKKSGESGIVKWDGKDPRYLILKNIPKSVDVKKGDTVLTSAYSFNFPPGHMLGTVDEIIPDNSISFYILKIKTTADFLNLHQVHVVENIQYDEQVRLFEETRKKIEENKKNPR